MQHPARGEQHQPISNGINLNRRVRKGKELQLSPITWLPCVIQVEYGCDASAINLLIAVIMQREAASTACMQTFSLHDLCHKMMQYNHSA